MKASAAATGASGKLLPRTASSGGSRTSQGSKSPSGKGAAPAVKAAPAKTPPAKTSMAKTHPTKAAPKLAQGGRVPVGKIQLAKPLPASAAKATAEKVAAGKVLPGKIPAAQAAGARPSGGKSQATSQQSARATGAKPAIAKVIPPAKSAAGGKAPVQLKNAGKQLPAKGAATKPDIVKPPAVKPSTVKVMPSGAQKAKPGVTKAIEVKQHAAGHGAVKSVVGTPALAKSSSKPSLSKPQVAPQIAEKATRPASAVAAIAKSAAAPKATPPKPQALPAAGQQHSTGVRTAIVASKTGTSVKTGASAKTGSTPIDADHPTASETLRTEIISPVMTAAKSAIAATPTPPAKPATVKPLVVSSAQPVPADGAKSATALVNEAGEGAPAMAVPPASSLPAPEAPEPDRAAVEAPAVVAPSQGVQSVPGRPSFSRPSDGRPQQMSNGRPMPPSRAAAKEESFVEGDYVVYPTHGVGKVEKIAIEDIAGHRAGTDPHHVRREPHDPAGAGHQGAQRRPAQARHPQDVRRGAGGAEGPRPDQAHHVVAPRAGIRGEDQLRRPDRHRRGGARPASQCRPAGPELLRTPDLRGRDGSSGRRTRPPSTRPTRPPRR